MGKHLKALLSPPASRSEDYSQAPLDLQASYCQELVITLDVESADVGSGDETYDVYVTTSDGKSTWDIVHFPQIATAGAKRYTARASRRLLPQNVTTAGPGVAAIDSATLKTDTAGSDQGIRTLAAGSVRHGAWGDSIGHELVVDGTSPGPFTYSITITGC